LAKNKDEGVLLNRLPVNFFTLLDGKKIKNLVELADSLKTMPNAVFGYHVNFQKNDFSEWVRTAFKDNELADDISKAEGKNDMIKLVEARISEVKQNIIKEREEEERLKQKKVNNAIEKEKAKRKEELKKKLQKKKSNLKKQTKQNKKYSKKLSKKTAKTKDSKTLKVVKEILEKEKGIFEKEREIDFREKKIQEIEERIEEKLMDMPNKEDIKKQNSLFSKDFIQGIVAGILLIALGLVIYWKFFL